MIDIEEFYQNPQKFIGELKPIDMDVFFSTFIENVNEETINFLTKKLGKDLNPFQKLAIREIAYNIDYILQCNDSIGFDFTQDIEQKLDNLNLAETSSLLHKFYKSVEWNFKIEQNIDLFNLEMREEEFWVSSVKECISVDEVIKLLTKKILETYNNHYVELIKLVKVTFTTVDWQKFTEIDDEDNLEEFLMQINQL